MKNANVFFTLSFGMLLGLIFALSTVQNPIEEKYETLLPSLRESEDTGNESSVLIRYPELKRAQKNIEAVKRLKAQVESSTKNPASYQGKGVSAGMINAHQEIQPLSNQTLHLLKSLDSQLLTAR